MFTLYASPRPHHPAHPATQKNGFVSPLSSPRFRAWLAQRESRSTDRWIEQSTERSTRRIFGAQFEERGLRSRVSGMHGDSKLVQVERLWALCFLMRRRRSSGAADRRAAAARRVGVAIMRWISTSSSFSAWVASSRSAGRAAARAVWRVQIRRRTCRRLRIFGNKCVASLA